LGDGLDEREAETGAARPSAGGAAEALERARQLLVGEPGALVDDVELDPLVTCLGGDLDRFRAVGGPLRAAERQQISCRRARCSGGD
jgi:hypothetical protein